MRRSSPSIEKVKGAGADKENEPEISRGPS
jgi:hypothetical protein